MNNLIQKSEITGSFRLDLFRVQEAEDVDAVIERSEDLAGTFVSDDRKVIIRSRTYNWLLQFDALLHDPASVVAMVGRATHRESSTAAVLLAATSIII
jgi:hypothetical protein